MATANPTYTKVFLRTKFLAKRRELGEDELEKRNQGLLEQLKLLDFTKLLGLQKRSLAQEGPVSKKNADSGENPFPGKNPHTEKTLHIFLSIRSQAEPDTFRMVDWINRHFAQVRWAVGKTERKTSGMYHFVWDEQCLIRENKWGIPEPQGGIRVEEQEIDLVFVPLLVIDRQGQRVGYGKGYYDRFLAKCRPDTLKVGISLFDPVDEISDASPTDIPLNACITPQGTFWFGDQQAVPEF